MGHGKFEAENCNLSELIEYAYNTKDYLISGPQWLNSNDLTFDVIAKAPVATPRSNMRLMAQALLASRFGLVVHRETKVLPVFELLVDKDGPKLPKPANPEGGAETSSRLGRIVGQRATMKTMADRLSHETGRPVIDKTGIQETFDFSLDISLGGDGDDRPSLSTALQRELGLRLNPAKRPVEILVVDHAEKTPKEN